MIGERLKEVRKAHHNTQAELSEKLKVSVFTIQSWEQGKSEPSHAVLVALCQLYHVSSDYLLGLTDNISDFVREKKSRLNKNDWKMLKEFACFLESKQKP